MLTTDDQHAESETIGRKAPLCESPQGRTRIKVRHLSQQTRALILDMFTAVESSEEVATRLGLPMRTVADVITLAALFRRGPQSSGGAPVMMRRTA